MSTKFTEAMSDAMESRLLGLKQRTLHRADELGWDDEFTRRVILRATISIMVECGAIEQRGEMVRLAAPYVEFQRTRKVY